MRRKNRQAGQHLLLLGLPCLLFHFFPGLTLPLGLVLILAGLLACDHR